MTPHLLPESRETRILYEACRECIRRFNTNESLHDPNLKAQLRTAMALAERKYNMFACTVCKTQYGFCRCPGGD